MTRALLITFAILPGLSIAGTIDEYFNSHNDLNTPTIRSVLVSEAQAQANNNEDGSPRTQKQVTRELNDRAEYYLDIATREITSRCHYGTPQKSKRLTQQECEAISKASGL
ncbi:hypothetical protein [uncultured Klebsiella sp.]|uniref:hypothetical protein n=1 Tax=Escherichia coli TaxID=562 RepID=UPI0017E756AE|nr:hypothetical protein [uncultured Klebsiella sp.]EFM0420428.1 hypothetical protein [Escherichia coli]ELC6182548.1 hypothetical protein [Escherichia coli]ELO4036813.1 hypothetical protein [Escherichia coli]HAN4255620.1 hypothetical protein [Escherichia coli]